VKLEPIIYKDKSYKECKSTADKEECMFRSINKIIADEMAVAGRISIKDKEGFSITQKIDNV